MKTQAAGAAHSLDPSSVDQAKPPTRKHLEEMIEHDIEYNRRSGHDQVTVLNKEAAELELMEQALEACLEVKSNLSKSVLVFDTAHYLALG